MKVRFFCAVLLSLIFITPLTLIFLLTEKISDFVYLAFVTISALLGLIFYFHDRIEKINLKEMEIILLKTQKVKRDIETISTDLVSVIANLSAYSTGSWRNRKELNDKVENFLISLGVKHSRIKEILDLPRIIEKHMRDKQKLSPEEQNKIDEMFNLEES